MKISEQNPAQTKIQKAKSANLAQIKIQKAKSAYVCVTVPWLQSKQKAQSSQSDHRATYDHSQIDLLLSLMHGVGHEYDVVMVLISSQRMTMSLEEAQFLLLMHEQRIEQLNSPSNFRGIFANFATNNAGDRRYHRSGSNYNRGGQRGRGRGGKFGGRKLYCQLSTKPGHQVFQCFHRFD
ncbi:hypothetical protein ACOSQ4_020933 [Xanthoceras sorbifolium]